MTVAMEGVCKRGISVNFENSEASAKFIFFDLADSVTLFCSDRADWLHISGVLVDDMILTVVMAILQEAWHVAQRVGPSGHLTVVRVNSASNRNILWYKLYLKNFCDLLCAWYGLANPGYVYFEDRENDLDGTL